MYRVDLLYDSLAVEMQHFASKTDALAFAAEMSTEPNIVEIQIDGEKYTEVA